MDLLQELLPLFMRWTPEVVPPNNAKLTLRQRAITTASILLIYLLMCQIPLYGAFGRSNDPFFQQRLILGSVKGTIMELGISPLLTSGLVAQLLSSTNLLPSRLYTAGSSSGSKNEESRRQQERRLQKTMGILVCFGQAVAYVWSGQYGSIKTLGGPGNALIIVVQLFGAGVIVILLDEILSLGYGLLQSGVSLFVAANVATDVVWKTLSPVTVFTSNKGRVTSEFYGVLPALVKALYATIVQPRRGLAMLWTCALDRGPGLPTLVSLLATAVIATMAAYTRQCKLSIPVQQKVLRAGQRGFTTLPIPLLYTGNMPVILLSSALSNLFMMSQMLYQSHPRHALVRLLGVWKPLTENSSVLAPLSGLAYYCSPPNNLYHAIVADPLHFVIHIIITFIGCAFFALSWVQISHTDVQSVSIQCKEKQWLLRSHSSGGTDTLDKQLLRIIPCATVLGALCVGTMGLLGDLFHAAGSGSGLLLAVGAIDEVLEVIGSDSNWGWIR